MTAKAKKTQQVDTANLPYPSKWDIIPIHASDRGSFKFCRRQWAWSSPSKRNLVPRATVHGVREPLWFGTGIHHALEKMYNPGLQEDPIVVFRAWFDVQWNGGLIDQSQLKEYIDREPEPIPDKPGTFRVMGLRDLLPFADEEKFEEYLDLGCGMLKHYVENAREHDNFRVIATEHDFSVPVVGPDGQVLYAHDTREMPESWKPDLSKSNIYGALMIEQADGFFKQVHTRGRMDLIIQDNDTGQYGIKDYKTTARTDEDYFRGLDLDEQCTSYLTFGEIEAKMNDLEYKELDFIIYEAILKGYPKPPTILKNGMPSLSRQTETTTPALFEAFINANGLQELFEADEKMQSYYAWLLETADKRFIVRTPVRRNKHYKESAMKRLYWEAVDMLSPTLKLYPTMSRNYGCLNCTFRGPCIAAEDGSDYKSILEDGYVENWDR